MGKSHLTIYLLKEYVTTFDDALNHEKNYENIEISENKNFYYYFIKDKIPIWRKEFFKGKIEEVRLVYSTIGGVLVIQQKIEGKNRIFAITFGYGKSLLDEKKIEEDFGLKTVLNIIDADKIRLINKKNIGGVSKDTREQLTKVGGISNFGIDIEQDLITEVTGVTTNESAFGKIVTGKDALTLAAHYDVDTIEELLEKSYYKYISNEYKDNFEWIDHIRHLRDKNEIDNLDEKLLERLKSKDFTSTWMAIPEIIQWDKILGFSWSSSKESILQDDLEIENFINNMSENKLSDLKIDYLRGKYIFVKNAIDEQFNSLWMAYNCIYSEVELNGKLYLLNSGKWYSIEKEYSTKINKQFETNIQNFNSLILPPSGDLNEPEYNKFVEKEYPNFNCLDGDTINHGARGSKIEFCDLLSDDNKFIHIKKYGSSSVLSHLFNQGIVSAELFLEDESFREKVFTKCKQKFINLNPNDPIDPTEYTILFGIISNKPGPLHLPFFSRITLNNAVKRLRGLRYNVLIQKIESSKEGK